MDDLEKNKKILHILIDKLKGDDPTRHMKIILYKWCLKCFLMRIEPPVEPPFVPIDFSNIHPELTNFDILCDYATNSADDIIRLLNTFPYEFFNVISKLSPKNAKDFSVAISKNHGIPVHLVARIISYFSLNIMTFDFSDIFEERCRNYETFTSFFEGLLCNNTNQIASAQILANHFDDVLNDDCLKLINSSIRFLEHFLDKNLPLTTKLFPETIILSFLIQTSTAPFSILAKAVKNMPPSEYITRFRNQLVLMQICGLGDNWKILGEKSIPFILGDKIYPEIFMDLPRGAQFMNISESNWHKDYDFINDYLTISNLITKKTLIKQIPNNLFIDIFSVLFLKFKSKKEFRRSSSLPSFQKNQIELSKIPVNNNKNVFNQNTNYVFDPQIALKVINILLKSYDLPQELKIYLNKAETKLKDAIALFENPIMEHALLPLSYFYAQSLTSLELIKRVENNFGNPPVFAISRKFSFLLENSLGMIKEFSKKFSSLYDLSANTIGPFESRVNNNRALSPSVIKIMNEVLNSFPEEIHSLLILDFASTHRELTLISTEIVQNQKYNDNYGLDKDIVNEYIDKLTKIVTQFPSQNQINLTKSRTLSDLQKKLNIILSYDLKNSLFSSWCKFLMLLTTIPGQTLHKLMFIDVKDHLLKFISNASSLNQVIEKFSGTGIDAIQLIILSSEYNNKTIFKKKLIKDLIFLNPIIGIIIAQGIMKNKEIYDILTTAGFHQNYKILKEFFKSKSDISLNNELKPSDEIRNKLNKIKELDQEKAMKELEILLFNVDLSPYFDEILVLINNFPKNWCITFIDTFISLINTNTANEQSDALSYTEDNIALIPLQQKLCELNYIQNHNHQFSNEIERASHQWDYLLKLLTKFDDILKAPERFYRLCIFHLQNHNIGRSLVTNVKIFTHIISFIRNYNLFDSETEKNWLNTFISSRQNVSNIKKSNLSDMIVDIGINHSLECAINILRIYEKVLNKYLLSSIKINLPKSVKLINYVQNKEFLIEDILSSLAVNNYESEEFCLRTLVKMRPLLSNYINGDEQIKTRNNNIYILFYSLNYFSHYGLYQTLKIGYSGSSLQKLKDISALCDLNDVYQTITHIPISQDTIKLLENELCIFGFYPSNSEGNKNNETKKLLYSSPTIPFDISSSNIQDYLDSHNLFVNNADSIPSLFSLDMNENLYNIYSIPLQEKEIITFNNPDYTFLDLEYGNNAVRISPHNTNNIFPETFAFAEIQSNPQTTENDRLQSEDDVIALLSPAVSNSTFITLLDNLNVHDFHMVLEFSNNHSLLNMILIITIYTLSHTYLFDSFVFPDSVFKTIQTESEKTKRIFDFLIALKQTLIGAVNLEQYDSSLVDVQLLFPQSIIPSGIRRTLDDLCLVYAHQIQIGINNISLFSPNFQSKSSVIAHLFAKGDIERGFALTRILKADIDEVMIEAASLVVQNNAELGHFLFKILPQLEPESSNQLIEALSSILVRDSQNESFLKVLISGIDDSRNVYQMLKWFGNEETSSFVAMMNYLPDEVEISMKDSIKKGLKNIQRKCKRWLLQHNQMKL